MELQTQAETIVYLILAACLSALIGMDRERVATAAGLRTHMLVGMGSCLFTALSLHAFPGSETSRVAAQIVTGIGFLGAGVIVERKHGVHNLTTAASIWVTAAIGMAVGAGAWLVAIGATVMIWIILVIIRRAEVRKKPNQPEGLHQG
jgi:putative Mg2+ transporter-C (MgtC) family protein